MIKNGRPYTCESTYEPDSALITDRPQEVQGAVFAWIHENIKPRKTPLLTRTSYGIKHIMHADNGIYLTNNEFKDAMMICGYKPVNERALNWNYCISKRSPAFKK